MTFTVRVAGGESFAARGDESLLAAAARAGVGLPCDCRLGGCGACRVMLLSGSVVYDEEPMALTPEDAEDGFALACQAKPTSDVEISIASAVLSPPRRCSAAVRAVRMLAPDVAHLQIAADGGDVEFQPGQYVKVLLDRGGTRNFSMASRPAGPDLDFHIRCIRGGRFTDGALRQLVPGDRLEIELPHGAFFYRENDMRPIVMAATGTGLAPIKSMLEALLEAPEHPPVTLYWGARTLADLYLHGDISTWRERYADFRYEPVLSRPDSSWRGRRGYVQDAVRDDCDELSGHAVYLCGSPLMIAAAREAFALHGADPGYIYADSFTFQADAR
ncbi:MAG TPA: 2Fe-2S iron-sulfur cluster-binding protein [Burkholderiales bacterium]|nr:2Fe-2S iron-sulfur cluster-binding protein [Burkholderiales bacterium]